MTGKVLIADDTEINRRILAAILRQAGLQTVLAKDGDEALALARSEQPDLILLDVMMPGKDGFQVLAALSKDPALAAIPVIFITARSGTQDKVRGFSLGAADYVLKPFEPEEVIARVKVQLRLREMAGSLARAYEELRHKQGLLEQDLRAAADIQTALLPRGPIELPHFSGAAFFLPAQSVGGDLFQVQRLDATRACAWILDVSGHGVPSAMVTVSVAQSISSTRLKEPGQVLAQLDAEYPMERFDRFFTMSYLLFDLWRHQVTASSAGHPPPLLLRQGTVRELSAGGTLVGLGTGDFAQEVVALEDGDRLVLYTDGVVELEDPAEQQFGPERFRALLRRTEKTPLEQAVSEARRELLAHASGRGPLDDVTLLVLDFRSDLSLPLHLAPELQAVRHGADRLREHWRSCGIPQRAAEQLELAFVEAANNVVLHGQPAGDLLVRSVFAGGAVTLTMQDDGLPIPEGRSQDAPADALAEGGRGGFLIRSLVDAVVYQSGPEGNVLTLRKGV